MIPALMAAAAANPGVTTAITTTLGSLLPFIIDAFRSGRSPDEAAAHVAKQRAEIIARLTASGMPEQQAAAMADTQLAGAFERAQIPEDMGPFAATVLSLAGAAGGFGAGRMIGKRLAVPKPGTPAATDMAAESAARAGVTAKTGTVPDFMPGEMESVPRAKSKDFAPWESMPEVQDAMSRKQASAAMQPKSGAPALGYEQAPRLGYNQTAIEMPYSAPSKPIHMGYQGTDLSADDMVRAKLAEIASAQPSVIGEIQGTMPGVGGFPASLNRAAARQPGIKAAQMDEAFAGRRNVADQTRQMQIDAEFEKAKLLELIDGLVYR